MSDSNWCLNNRYCRFNLGLLRSEMPQIPNPPSTYLAWLEKKGVPLRKKTVKASELRPTQKEISRSKVESILSGGCTSGVLFVSSDYHLLDGHHRWAAFIEQDPNQLVQIVKIGMNIGDLIPLSLLCDGIEQRNIKQSSKIACLKWSLFIDSN